MSAFLPLGRDNARYLVPARESDGGPQDPAETRDWFDWTREAVQEAQAALYCRYSDDSGQANMLRRQSLQLAKDAIDCALEQFGEAN